MAATMNIQISSMRLLCFVIFVGKVHCADFPLTGNELTRDEDTNGHNVSLPGNLTFPFRGRLYKNLYVSKDGLVGFHPGTLHQTEIFTETLTRGDPAFIAPYYFPAQDIGSKIGSEQYTGKILYRTPGSGAKYISKQELSNYSSIIQQSMIGINQQFNATFGLAVTWKEVVSKTDVLKGCTFPCNNNTFQLVLLTDGTNSFAIFNYITMNINQDRFTQSGFNAGEGRGYTTALTSEQLKSANILHGSDVKGRFIYRVDTEEIQKGGCSNDLGTGGILTINPTYAGMYGGKMLDISGPCMFMDQRTTIVKCRFNKDDNLITYGIKINSMKARCPVPLMNVRGWITIEMSINSRPFIYSTRILIVFPGRLKMEEFVQLPDRGPDNRWNETTANQLTLLWNSSLLVPQSDMTSIVNISLWGYRENANGVVWQNLRSIGTGIIRASTGIYTFPAASIACVGRTCDEFEIGIVKVELRDENKATSHAYLTSHILPLGFFVGNALTMQLGDDWPYQKCISWYNKDKQDMNWLSNLQSCPCNLVQALTDIGRWQTDVGCDLYSSNPHKCKYHIGAVHCVRSVQPSSDGAGNQCCYDASGNLRFSADSFQGSTPDRSHAWGAAPYGRADLVPDASHWVKDVVTFYYCCLWTDYKDCDYYMDQRVTRDCTGYTPPTPAMLYGQGHIQTFDGYHQRMCGEGDFILMTTNLTNGDKVTVQGRFYRNAFPKIVGERGNSSVMLVNVGIQVVGDTTESVEIRLKLPTSDRSKRHLDVLVNNHYYYFGNKESRWQDFKYFSVVNVDDISKESNFTIILENGLGLQIADCEMTLCVLIMAPPSLQGKIDGLLGNFNGNATDDLKNLNYTTNMMVQNGQLTELNLYQMFKYPWAATKQTTVIPMLYEPVYNPPICSLDQPNRLLPACQNNKECTFDYRATGDERIATKTKAMSERFKTIDQFVMPERTCGLLNVPRSIKDNYNYKLGQTVTITGCKTGSLSGDDMTYTCTSTSNTTQSWSPSVTASCTATVEVADTAMIVGIVVGILAFFVIIIIIGVLIRKTRRNNKGKYSEGQGRNPVTDGKATETSAYYSRPHKVPQEDVEDKKRSSQEYSL